MIQGSRWGVGNSIRVENGGSSVVVDDDGVTIDGEAVAKTPPAVWSSSVWSEERGRTSTGAPGPRGGIASTPGTGRTTR